MQVFNKTDSTISSRHCVTISLLKFYLYRLGPALQSIKRLQNLNKRLNCFSIVPFSANKLRKSWFIFNSICLWFPEICVRFRISQASLQLKEHPLPIFNNTSNCLIRCMTIWTLEIVIVECITHTSPSRLGSFTLFHGSGKNNPLSFLLKVLTFRRFKMVEEKMSKFWFI